MRYPKSVQGLALGLGFALGALHFAVGQAATSTPKEAARVAIESNVLYGMYSGTALLLDVYRPASPSEPNGKGILIIPGSGWHSGLSYGTTSLKDSRPAAFWSALTDAGYTLFVINHRAAPRFHYPEPVKDAQRAVRFVRYNAKRFGVDPDRLGALGHSSGGYLASMLGVLDGAGDPKDVDPVDRESAKVQAVVAGAPPIDLTQFDAPTVAQLVAVYLGQAQGRAEPLYKEASPFTHVTPQSAPFLLVHGDADDVVPYRNSEAMVRALREAGVDVEFMPLPGAGHADFPVRLAVPWLNRHLLGIR